MTVGYIDASALAAMLTPGQIGQRIADVWRSIDAMCAHSIVNLEVPSVIGRHLDRVAWVWTLHSLSVVEGDPQGFQAAIDLAWLGAPPLVALHVAVAAHLEADHFVTTDPVAASWATIHNLSVVTFAD